MGLDTYARDINGQLPEEAASAFARSGIKLCGGMFSGHGDSGSFRGKVYTNLVEAATGVDLYQERIDTETVEDMIHNMRLAREDLDELIKFMQVVVDYDLELVGVW